MKRLPRVSYLEIELPYLPDNGKVGGNASHFNPQARGAALKKERKYWREALTVAGFPLNTEAIMVSPLQLNIIVQYPTSKRGPYPDIDNMTTALKPLLDSMEIHRFTRLNNRGEWEDRGFAGIYENDRDVWGQYIEYRRGDKPLTVVQIQTLTREVYEHGNYSKHHKPDRVGHGIYRAEISQS